MLTRPSLVERLPAVTPPTLFVGTTDDPTWPLELARQHAARLANGRFVELSGSRHLPPLETPEALGLLLVDWLEERMSVTPPAPR